MLLQREARIDQIPGAACVSGPFKYLRTVSSRICVQSSRVEASENPIQHGARLLLDAESQGPAAADGQANITAVTSVAKLQAAMTSRAQDILVQSHVDLTDLPLAFNSNTSLVATALGDFKASAISIRVFP